MLKVFNKIIISFLLVLVIFSGINILKINTALAADRFPGLTQTESDLVYSKCPLTSVSYNTCIRTEAEAIRETKTQVQIEAADTGITVPVTPITGQPVSEQAIEDEARAVEAAAQARANADAAVKAAEEAFNQERNVAESIAYACSSEINCCDEEKAYQADKTNTDLLAARQACLGVALKNEQEKREDESLWGAFKTVAGNGLKLMAEGATRTVIGVIGGIYQLLLIPLLGIILRIVAACMDFGFIFTLDSTKIETVNAAIVTVWTLVRNIFNVTFIFILLYVAIKTIIGSASINTKKMIKDVVVAALLINFSLFITRICIDAGNILAVGFYNTITSNSTVSFSSTAAGIVNLGALFSSTGATSMFSTDFFVISMLQIITMLIAIVTFSFITLLMIVRTVILIFLMATSPIGFMGDIIPKISEHTKLWRETLYGQIMIAPVFLLFYYLITLIGNDLAPQNLTATDGKDYIGYFRYIIIIILLITAVKATKKLSGEIGKIVEKTSMLAVGAVAAYATGGASLLATSTLGKGASKMASSAGLNAAANEGGMKGFGARMALKGLNKTANSSFDVRNTGAFKQTMGLAGLKVDAGKPKEGGYLGMIKRREKEAKERVEAAADVKGMKIDPYSIDQKVVTAESLKRRGDAQQSILTLESSIQKRKDSYNEVMGQNISPAARKEEEEKYNKEIEKLKKDLKKAQDTTAKSSYDLEDDIRKDLAKQESLKKARERVRSFQGKNSNTNKQAAEALRSYIKDKEKDKTDTEKQTELLSELVKNSKDKPTT